ncbi:alpha-galactosidase D [Lentzea flaviverrucosa]|uniref:Alpha-galactosidase n=1 Tax=Lentzea flaviverrucosa TaxID=200379 RepID=A0A1H9G993_9PSEU|nr:alpha-galactosidase [Lentzea flaviverrucosa]RDI34975.1 alpha galactosidase A [Lentzea flaviverrucosa]SEQ46715.1 Alpha galactosidase A [Lentzea flaviverrucosa]
MRALGVVAGLLASLIAVPAAVAQAPQVHQQTAAQAEKPYMGWSSWTLQATNYPGVNPDGPASWLNEKNVVAQADVLAARFKKAGYDHVNVDAGWLGSFDEYGRPVVDAKKFPRGFKWLGDHIHGKGMKFGSYLAVGLDPKAYNDGKTPIHNAPGCTTKDVVYPDLRKTNGWDSAYKMDFANPCSQKYIDSLAQTLAGWGVDFLKLDGVGPGSFRGGERYDNTTDVKAWNSALKSTGRPIEFLISWALSHRYADVWKANTNGWRVDTDVECYCDTLVTWNQSVKQRWNDVVQWIDDAGPGHWNNLDSVAVGNGQMDGLTEAERQSYMTLWSISSSPLYIGDDLTKIDDFGYRLLTNNEVIAINQAGVPARPVDQSSDQQVWYARNRDGSYTVALFNLGATPAKVTADFARLGIHGNAKVRDVWAKKDVGQKSGSLTEDLPVHGSKLFTITPRGSVAPGVVQGTAATPNSVSLKWYGKTGVRYDVYAGTRKVATTTDTKATVTGLTPATSYEFTVVQNGARSKPVSFVTPQESVTYEAEKGSPGGGATVYGCACSGGSKVGYLGGSGILTMPAVTAPREGTYLVELAYISADASRTGIVTVNGTSFELPVAGSNDDDWNTPQKVTVPIYLLKGTNTIRFGNPDDSVFDVDSIRI